MDGKSFIEFQKNISRCSDDRLFEVLEATVKEINSRLKHKRAVDAAVESISKIESDW